MKTYTFLFHMTVLVCICFLYSCQNSHNQSPNHSLTARQKTALLLARSTDATIVLLPQDQINQSFFTRFGVPPDLRREFTLSYERLRSDLGQVREEYRDRRSTRYFFINRYCDSSDTSQAKSDSVKYLSIPANPIFMAFALLAEGLPVGENIGSPTYIKTLARSFNTSEIEIYEGIRLCLKNQPVFIYEAVALMMDKNLQDARSADPHFFFRNVVIPYALYLSKGNRIFAPLEQRIFEQFHLVFEKTGKENALKNYIRAFDRYVAGASMNVRFGNELNRVLAQYGYRIAIHENSCVAYSILDYRIPIGKQNIRDVLFLKKISLSLSQAIFGSATMKEKNVIVIFDNIEDHARDIRYALDHQQPVSTLAAASLETWTSLGFDLDSANRILTLLLKKEFGALSDQSIVSRLVKETALHEVKHKWDETVGARNEWFNVDCEVSASLAATVFSDIPLYSLAHFIYTFQEFYTDIREEEVTLKIKPLLHDAWRIAQAAAQDAMSTQQVKDAARKMYNGYSLLAGDSLPDISLFQSRIVDSCFAAMPVLVDNNIMNHVSSP